MEEQSETGIGWEYVTKSETGKHETGNRALGGSGFTDLKIISFSFN